MFFCCSRPSVPVFTVPIEPIKNTDPSPEIVIERGLAVPFLEIFLSLETSLHASHSEWHVFSPFARGFRWLVVRVLLNASDMLRGRV